MASVRKLTGWGAGVAVALAGLSGVTAQTSGPDARPVFTPDGTVHVPAFDLPPSAWGSAEATALQKGRVGAPSMAIPAGVPIDVIRKGTEVAMQGRLAEARARYPVDIVEQVIGGVRARIVTPKGGEADASRVLINLHGGAFMTCADACALIESIPIASVGRFRVVTVDYRQGPENVFPAASQDVASVYQELLRRYRPGNVGIYGCSAGGALSAQAVAWFADRNIPQPGAVGIFGAGAVRFGAGDSAYLAAFVDGSFPPPEKSSPMAYFKGARMDDPLISPAAYPQYAAKFPPTLLITGTRAPDLSPAAYTNSQLLKAGVNSRLIVAEGLGHCYIYEPTLPEARDAYDQIVRFFNENLGHGGGGGTPARRDEARQEPDRPRQKDCAIATRAPVASPGADGKFYVRRRDPGCRE